MAAAQVVAVGSRQTAQVDRSGQFAFSELLPGPELLLVRAIGYEPQRHAITLEAGDSVTLTAVLAPAPQQLAELEVTAYGSQYRGRLTGFARRMLSTAAPRSSFVTPEEIAVWGAFDLANVFRRAGLRVSGNRISCPVGGSLGSRNGSLHVYLDDALVNDGPIFDITSYPVQWIAAAEIYRRIAEAPVQYQILGAGCVVILTTST